MPDDLRRLRVSLAAGIEIAVLDFGGVGPPALLHHATGFCAALWAPVAEAMRRRFRVFAMDARGHGDSSQPARAEGYAWSHFGSDARCVAQRIAHEHGPLALGLGHSLGGTALMLAAIEQPGLFERLVLVDPIVMPSDPEVRARLSRGNSLADAARRRREVWDSRSQARERWAGKQVFAEWDPRVLDLYVAEGLRDRADGCVELKCPAEVEATIFEASVGLDALELAQRLETPTCILWARRGNFPLEHFEELAARVQRGRVRELDTGHLAPMEAPDLVAAEALAFSAASETRDASSRSSLRATRRRS